MIYKLNGRRMVMQSTSEIQQTNIDQKKGETQIQLNPEAGDQSSSPDTASTYLPSNYSELESSYPENWVCH